MKNPRRYIKKVRQLRNAYGELISFLEKRGFDNSFFNKNIPNFVLNLFLKPSEIIIIAQKKKNINKENMFAL